MEQQEWQSLYEILDRIHSDFLNSYNEFKKGSNIKIRSNAQRRVENAIRLATYHIEKNIESYILLTGEENNSEQGRTIFYDEFKQLRYFGYEMGNFLKKIREKIDSLDK